MTTRLNSGWNAPSSTGCQYAADRRPKMATSGTCAGLMTTPQACFDARAAGENPAAEWLTMEDPRARAIIGDVPRFVAGQPLPVIRVTGLQNSVNGIWSLWEIGLAAPGANRKRFLPVFINDEGRPFVPTAKRVWDLLLTETVSVQSVADAEASVGWFEASFAVAGAQGEALLAALADEHRARIKEERDRATYAFDTRDQAIGRIGLPAVRQFRRRRLQSEHEARLAALDDMKSSVPELNAVAMVRIDATAGKTSGARHQPMASAHSWLFHGRSFPAVGGLRSRRRAAGREAAGRTARPWLRGDGGNDNPFRFRAEYEERSTRSVGCQRAAAITGANRASAPRQLERSAVGHRA